MRDSIIVNMEYADLDIIDLSPNAERHHCLYGSADRKKADMDGLWLPLSHEHHQGNNGVHHNKEMQMLTKIIAQLAWEKNYIIEVLAKENGIPPQEWNTRAREAFLKRYGRTFI